MKQKSFTLQELAKLTNSLLIGDPHKIIYGYSDLEKATSDEISFFSIPQYGKVRLNNALKKTKAGALIVSEKNPHIQNALINKFPNIAFQKVVEIFLQDLATTHFQGIAPSAVIHETAKIQEGVTIGPNCVIDAYVTVGAGTTIGPLSYIGPYSTIGQNCTLHAKVTIRERVSIGNRVTIQPGVVIGSCGFGYDTNEFGEHIPLKQLGTVIVEDDVDIGANTTIDRARFQITAIGKGTKIDNLVQIAHGVNIGPHNLIVAQVGIAGSTKTGAHVVLGGQVAVNGHIELTSHVMVTGKSGVSKSIDKPGKYGGIPAVELGDYNRQAVLVRHLPDLVKRLKKLEKDSGSHSS